MDMESENTISNLFSGFEVVIQKQDNSDDSKKGRLIQILDRLNTDTLAPIAQLDLMFKLFDKRDSMRPVSFFIKDIDARGLTPNRESFLFMLDREFSYLKDNLAARISPLKLDIDDVLVVIEVYDSKQDMYYSNSLLTLIKI